MRLKPLKLTNGPRKPVLQVHATADGLAHHRDAYGEFVIPLHALHHVGKAVVVVERHLLYLRDATRVEHAHVLVVEAAHPGIAQIVAHHAPGLLGIALIGREAIALACRSVHPARASICGERHDGAVRECPIQNGCGVGAKVPRVPAVPERGLALSQRLGEGEKRLDRNPHVMRVREVAAKREEGPSGKEGVVVGHARQHRALARIDHARGGVDVWPGIAARAHRHDAVALGRDEAVERPGSRCGKDVLGKDYQPVRPVSHHYPHCQACTCFSHTSHALLLHAPLPHVPLSGGPPRAPRAPQGPTPHTCIGTSQGRARRAACPRGR